MAGQIKESVFAFVIAGCMAFFYIVGFPFKNLYIPYLDLRPDTIGLCIQAFVVWMIGMVCTHCLCPHYSCYEKKSHSYYLGSVLVLFIVPFVSILWGLYPLEATPSLLKIGMEGILYYVLVGLIEEFFCRGLILQSLQRLTSNAMFSIVCTALIYGLLHIPGMIGQPMLVVCMRSMWSVGLGIYLGFIYVNTQSLGYVSLVHMIADWAALPFVFSRLNFYPAQSAAIIFMVYLGLGCYGLGRLNQK